MVVATRDGWVLLMRRRRPAGFWQSVTGSLKWGETARDAAVRELYEETGLHAGGGLIDLHHQVRFPIVAAWRARYAPDAHWNLEHWYALILPHRRLIRLSPREHREYRWLPWPQAARRATSWTNREAIFKVQRTEDRGQKTEDRVLCRCAAVPSFHRRSRRRRSFKSVL